MNGLLCCLLYFSTFTIICIYSFDLYKSRLAIDYGPRYIGIATSLGQNIQPVSTISNHGNLSLLSGEIINIARKTGAIELIVGVPLDRDGIMKYTVRNLNGIICLNFSSVLACICNQIYPKASVLIMDERYTTREAKEKSKFEYTRASLDAVSAACLLERYIEDEGTYNVLPALPCSYPPPYDLELFDYSIVSKYIRMIKGSKDNTDNVNGNQHVDIGNKKQGLPQTRASSHYSDNKINEIEVTSFSAEEYWRLKRNKQSDSTYGIEIDKKEFTTIFHDSDDDEATSDENDESMKQLRERSMRRRRGTLKKKPPAAASINSRSAEDDEDSVIIS